jgi:hypothetical protein
MGYATIDIIITLRHGMIAVAKDDVIQGILPVEESRCRFYGTSCRLYQFDAVLDAPVKALQLPAHAKLSIMVFPGHKNHLIDVFAVL